MISNTMNRKMEPKFFENLNFIKNGRKPQNKAESGLVNNGGVATGTVISLYLKSLAEHIALKRELAEALANHIALKKELTAALIKINTP